MPSAATFVPFLPGSNTACNSNLLCIPNQKFSITQAYLGFGSATSYSGKFYYLCGPVNFEAITHVPPC